MSNLNNLYSTAVSETIKAISSDAKTEGQYKRAGSAVVACFTTEDAIREIKAQFIVDAIIPAMDKKHQTALNTDLVRKNSKEFQAYDSNMRAQWQESKTAKDTARQIADVYFNRVVGYAFPKSKVETETDSIATDLKTKINEQIANMIKKCQKTENANFDINATIQALQNVLTVVNK